MNIKNSIHNPKLDENLKAEFEALWVQYPRRLGKQQAFKHFKNARNHGVLMDTIKSGLHMYLKYLEENKVDILYTKHGSTWFRDHCWEDEY
jgi:hypothetical protein